MAGYLTLVNLIRFRNGIILPWLSEGERPLHRLEIQFLVCSGHDSNSYDEFWKSEPFAYASGSESLYYIIASLCHA